MIAIPQHGLVFLAMTKCASTSIEDALFEHSVLVTRKNPGMKHMRYRRFERFIAPYLRSQGFARGDYEVVCLMREPISWLHSWWRYRSRPQLANANAPRRRRNYTGDVSFEHFVRAYIERSETYARSIGRQAEFVRGPNDELVGVDRLFRYEELDTFVAYASDRLGEPLAIGTANVSPEGDLQLPPDLLADLRDHLADEYRIYTSYATGEQIEAPPLRDDATDGTDAEAGGADATTRQTVEVDA